MTISKAAYAISRARLAGLRVELFELMMQRGKLPQNEQAEVTARIRRLLPRISRLDAKLRDC